MDLSSRVTALRTSPRRPVARVLLDTNVWRYIVDEQAVPALLAAVRTKSTEILIAPGVVYEGLRTRDADVRQRLAWAMTRRNWRRLMPEAFSEAQELLGEIRRLRPAWLRPSPNRTWSNRFRRDWSRLKGGFWDRVQFSPDDEARHIRDLGDEHLEAARVQAQERRDAFRQSSWKETDPLDKTFAEFIHPPRGWKGGSVEAWRAFGWSTTTMALATKGHPYLDWLSDEVDLAQIRADHAAWIHFWFIDADVKAMPRFWVRWAFEHIQQFRRVTDGTPGDAQIATYLLDADIVVSADRGLIQILERVRGSCPFRLAEGHLVEAGKPGVDALLQRLRQPFDK